MPICEGIGYLFFGLFAFVRSVFTPPRRLSQTQFSQVIGSVDTLERCVHLRCAPCRVIDEPCVLSGRARSAVCESGWAALAVMVQVRVSRARARCSAVEERATRRCGGDDRKDWRTVQPSVRRIASSSLALHLLLEELQVLLNGRLGRPLVLAVEIPLRDGHNLDGARGDGDLRAVVD